MSITIKSEMIVPAAGKPTMEIRDHHYLDAEGLRRRETRSFQSQSDTRDYSEYRDSPDNGRTWGEWIRKSASTRVKIGNTDEIAYMPYEAGTHIWNPVHRHFITLNKQFLYVDGYEKAEGRYWQGFNRCIHSFLEIEDASGLHVSSQFIRYEDGIDFDESTYRQSDYLDRNLLSADFLLILRNGDILFTAAAPMASCCHLEGKDVYQVFPSAPLHATGLLIFRGCWNETKKTYDLSFSKPVMLDDRVGSRGLGEATPAELESGKILIVIRSSNCMMPHWNSRISPYAPNYKYFIISDDGGKSFSPIMPWYFDTREVVYSSATYSLFLRSKKNGKLYWFGNITNPTKNDGNYPRFPLQMVEIDEEWGVAKKDTLTVIDTRREGETEQVQLSNFILLEDRETGNIELYLCKVGQFEGRDRFDCETWKYTIFLPD